MNERREHSALEARLVLLGNSVEWPETKDFSAAVHGRIEAGERTTPRRSIFAARPAFGIALALIALIAATLALFPGARRAVADWLGISGIEIRVQENAPTPTQTVESLQDLDLGDEVSAAEAQEAVDFDLLLPQETEVGEPRVFLRQSPVPAVTFVYTPGPELPRSEQTGAGMLLTEFRGAYTPDLVKKVSSTSRIEVVSIGDNGFWLEGEPHVVFFRDEDGDVQADPVRSAGNTLIWEEDGVSYRIEADIDKDEALRIARSLE